MAEETNYDLRELLDEPDDVIGDYLEVVPIDQFKKDLEYTLNTVYEDGLV